MLSDRSILFSITISLGIQLVTWHVLREIGKAYITMRCELLLQLDYNEVFVNAKCVELLLRELQNFAVVPFKSCTIKLGV